MSPARHRRRLARLPFVLGAVGLGLLGPSLWQRQIVRRVETDA